MLTICGASDDLIEVEGDIREEFYLPGSKDDAYIAVSNGALLRVDYTNVWRITPVVAHPAVTITQCPEDDEDNYTDRAVIDGPVTWVALATAVAK